MGSEPDMEISISYCRKCLYLRRFSRCSEGCPKKNHLYNLNMMLKPKNALKVWQKAFLSADTSPESRKTKSVWKGHSAEDIADTLNISVSLVKEWIEQNAPASTNNI